MSKTTIGLLLALVVGAAALYYVRDRESVPDELAYPQRAFGVSDREAVARIFIADMAGRSMDLRRQRNGTWLIDDSLVANVNTVQQTVAALEQLRIDHVPTRAVAAVQRQNLASRALKVEAYDEEGRKLTGILIGSGAPKGAGSYMVVDGYDEIFAVKRGMLTGSVRPQFDLRSVAAWRSQDFMKYAPTEIDLVEIRYPRLPSRSFRVERTDGGFEVSALTEIGGEPRAAPTRRVERFLEGFADVPLARWVNDHAYRDSISAMTPFAQVIVATAVQRDTYELQPAALLNENGLPDQSLPFNTYWVERGSSDFVTVQDHQIQQILQTYDSFFE